MEGLGEEVLTWNSIQIMGGISSPVIITIFGKRDRHSISIISAKMVLFREKTTINVTHYFETALF